MSGVKSPEKVILDLPDLAKRVAAHVTRSDNEENTSAATKLRAEIAAAYKQSDSPTVKKRLDHMDGRLSEAFPHSA
jgi:hypothetical protein